MPYRARAPPLSRLRHARERKSETLRSATRRAPHSADQSDRHELDRTPCASPRAAVSPRRSPRAAPNKLPGPPLRLLRPPQARDRRAFVAEPRTPSFDEADVRDKPTFVRQRPRVARSARAALRLEHGCRLASLRAVDRGVREMYDALRRVGELDDTVVIFTSDNGWFAGQHRIAAEKAIPYEEPSVCRCTCDCRHDSVPLRGSEIQRGSRTSTWRRPSSSWRTPGRAGLRVRAASSTGARSCRSSRRAGPGRAAAACCSSSRCHASESAVRRRATTREDEQTARCTSSTTALRGQRATRARRSTGA